jgi:hypothetical protein
MTCVAIGSPRRGQAAATFDRVRDPDVVRLGVEACRAELDRTGLLLVQDARLPCATTLVADEVRLLLHTDEIHTDSGRHVKALQPWDAWAAAKGLVDFPSIDAGDAR